METYETKQEDKSFNAVWDEMISQMNLAHQKMDKATKPEVLDDILDELLLTNHYYSHT